MRRTLFLLITALASQTARANVVSYTAGVPMTAANWTTTVNLQRFDPALGTLLSVTVSLSIQGGGWVQVESLDTVPTSISMHVALPALVLRPDLSYLIGAEPFDDFFDSAAPFDGTVDFAGPSGFTHGPFNPLQFVGLPLHSDSDRQLFTGPSGNAGTVALTIEGMKSIAVMGFGGTPGATFAGVVHDSLASSAMLHVLYEYAPGVGASFCSGDGTATTCPCGNASALQANQGCANSLGFGASLTATGTPNVFNDTLALQCAGLPGNTPALLFQGTVRESFGSGSVFGDGLRCVSGTVRRLQTAQASAGLATWPVAGAPSISVSGGAQSGQLLHYQVWYRNAASFCTPATFNLSQGSSVAWVM